MINDCVMESCTVGVGKVGVGWVNCVSEIGWMLVCVSRTIRDGASEESKCLCR